MSGKIENGRIYGRGSCDMKGPVVAQTMAVKALQKVGIHLNGDLILTSTVGEENMDSATIGAGDIVNHGYSADAAVRRRAFRRRPNRWRWCRFRRGFGGSA